MNGTVLPAADRRWRHLLTTLFGLALGLTSAAGAETRTFTDTSGRTMVAEIMDATETTARVRREDGRVFDLTLDQLAEADRAYVAAWRTSQAFAFGGIEVTAHRVRIDADRTQTRSNTTKTEDWCYKISIANRSRADLAGLTVEYRMFFLSDDLKVEREELPLQRKSGSTAIDHLAARSTVELQTTVVTLRVIQLKPGYHYSGTSRRRVEDSLAGLWVRVVRHGEVLHEFADPTTLIKSQGW